jgi:hypothetical protein
MVGPDAYRAELANPLPGALEQAPVQVGSVTPSTSYNRQHPANRARRQRVVGGGGSAVGMVIGSFGLGHDSSVAENVNRRHW